MARVDLAGPYLIHPTPPAPTPGVIVGPPPQWEDGSDATYAEATFTWDSTGAFSDQIRADLHPPHISGTLTALTLTMRAEVSAEYPSTSVLRPALFINDANTDEGIVRFDHYLSAVDTIETVTYAPDEMGFLNGQTMASLGTTLLAGDAYLNVTAQQPSSSGQWNRIRVYEVSIDSVWASTNPPQLRKYPNPTGLGVGPARQWPRPRRGITGIR